MRRMILIISLFTILPKIIFSQDLYYWENGNKIFVKKDYSSFVIYEKFNAKYIGNREEIISEYHNLIFA